jgi:NADP-reducing hydrogenase subunit HndB
VEITIPGETPVIFGYVDLKKADEIIERFIRKGELIDGIIPVNYDTIEVH